jgi:flagellar hook-length control protein FliK
MGRDAAGKSAQPGESAPPGADFSHTLALSLSTPERPAAGRASPTAGKSAKALAREAGHGEKTDPVAVAMALMDRAGPTPPPVAARASAPNPGGKPAGPVVVAQAGQSTGAVTAAATAAVHTVLAESMPGAAAAGHPAAASVGQPGGAGPLTAAQLVASTQASASNPSTSAGGPALAAPVGSGAWTEQLAARLTWMTQQGVQSASLQLSPRNLGPLQVSISVQHGQASVWFGATQPETRQALARALPELRNLFANQGLSLTDSGVSHDAPRQARAGPGGAAGGEASGMHGDGSAAPALPGVGLIDTYA